MINRLFGAPPMASLETLLSKQRSAHVDEIGVDNLIARQSRRIPIIGQNKHERDAFFQLSVQREKLGLRRIWKCQNILLDGFAETKTGEIILIEVKTSLGWISMCNAFIQLANGKTLLPDIGKYGIDPARIDSARGLILFQDMWGGWSKSTGNEMEAWAHFYRHVAEFSYMKVDALQLQGNEFVNPVQLA